MVIDMRGDAFGVPGLDGRKQRLVRSRDLMRIVVQAADQPDDFPRRDAKRDVFERPKSVRLRPLLRRGKLVTRRRAGDSFSKPPGSRFAESSRADSGEIVQPSTSQLVAANKSATAWPR